MSQSHQWKPGKEWCSSVTKDYRKVPVISPGPIQLRKGFWVGYGGAYIQGAYKRYKKTLIVKK